MLNEKSELEKLEDRIEYLEEKLASVHPNGFTHQSLVVRALTLFGYNVVLWLSGVLIGIIFGGFFSP